MHYIKSVEIIGFWSKYTAKMNFQEDINILIGKNGTGKTNFMNLLQAVLRVDTKMLSELEYESITIKLQAGKKTKTINVERKLHDQFPFEIATFKVGTKKYDVPLLGQEAGIHSIYRRRITSTWEEYEKLKDVMNSFINISSLSVNRTAYNHWYEEEPSKQTRSQKPPIDLRLEDLITQLTSFQLSLSKESDLVSAKFQKDVLASNFFDAKFDNITLDEALDVDLEKVKTDLIRAYAELGANESGILTKINKHIAALEKSVTTIKEKLINEEGFKVSDITPLPLLKRTQHIINLSVEADRQKKTISKPISQFVNIITEFISDKNFKINSKGAIEITKDSKPISPSKLSSGEKQILILLIETLLQKNKSFIFLADEPELSLHIEWQAKVISSIKRLNSNSQVIVATHSPEITAGWSEKIVDMEDVING
jgi:predicted ATP-dependent endonuclease of OLD family